MKDVYDFAKYYIKNGADTIPNTFDGNMKLQKLLVLADFANIVEYGVPLFNEQVLAFRNGCVVEKVRLRYKNNYQAFKKDSEDFIPDFSKEEYAILNMTLGIFGHATARELSDINHSFEFWKKAYKNSMTPDGFHHKDLSVCDMISQPDDIERMRLIINAYKENQNDAVNKEIINGIAFFYDDIELTDSLIDQLEVFSLSADESEYNIYLDDGKLVIF